MNKKNIFSFIFIFVMSSVALSQTAPAVSTQRIKRAYFDRRGVVIDYNSWFEKINLSSPSGNSDQKGILYGLGVNYEYNRVYSDYGFGGFAGFITGNALTGSASDSSGYYIPRTQFLALRAGGRYFIRVTPQFEFGVVAQFLYKNLNWAEKNSYSPARTKNPQMGGFLDSRFRISPRWELAQSLGLYAENTSVAWRFGGSYLF